MAFDGKRVIITGAGRGLGAALAIMLADKGADLLLTGRSRFGWRGRKAVRVLYTGTGLLLLGYAGSRFVLEVILGRVA